jgi:hypothetical protein
MNDCMPGSCHEGSHLRRMAADMEQLRAGHQSKLGYWTSMVQWAKARALKHGDNCPTCRGVKV